MSSDEFMGQVGRIIWVPFFFLFGCIAKGSEHGSTQGHSVAQCTHPVCASGYVLLNI